jgi:putative endopeptidase
MKNKIDKLFFVAYATCKRQLYRKKALARIIITDNHSPEFIRINTVLKQFGPFHTTFKIKSGDPMFLPEHKRPFIW